MQELKLAVFNAPPLIPLSLIEITTQCGQDGNQQQQQQQYQKDWNNHNISPSLCVVEASPLLLFILSSTKLTLFILELSPSPLSLPHSILVSLNPLPPPPPPPPPACYYINFYPLIDPAQIR